MTASLRFPISIALSFVLTVGLFLGMRTMTNARGEHDEQLSVSKVEFVRLRRESEIEARKREKPEREKPEQAPVTPTLAVAEEEGFDTALDVEAIAAGMGAEFGSAGGGGGSGMGGLGFSAGLADRAPLPLVRIEPQYPPRAQRKKLEGWVQVRFTISTAGSVRDAIVIQSSDAIFERNAIQAVSKWKYQPQLQAGKPTEAPGQHVVVRFKMKG